MQTAAPIRAAPQVVVHVPTAGTNVISSYAGKAAQGLGATQIAIGIICIIMNICLVNDPYKIEFAFGLVGTGFWCGVMVSTELLITYYLFI